MFKHDEEWDAYLAELNGIEFICEEPSEELEETAKRLAEVYEARLPDLAAFILEEMETDGLGFGPLTVPELTAALGEPQIDLDTSVIHYMEQTLDGHIFDVEYEGDLEEFLVFTLDG